MSATPNKTMLDAAMGTDQPVYFKAKPGYIGSTSWTLFNAADAYHPDIGAFGYEWFVGKPPLVDQATEQRTAHLGQALYNGDPFPGIGASAARGALEGSVIGGIAPSLAAAPQSVGYWTFDERGSFRMFHPTRPNWLHRQTCALLLGIRWVDL